MIGNTDPIRFFLPLSVVLVLLAADVAQATQNVAGNARLVEMFTTTGSLVTREAEPTQPDSGAIDLQIYKLDGIQRIKAKLSEGLTADPERSKQIVLGRLQRMDDAERAHMKRAAMGLAKALQYGVDRYPAIVFDGEAVVYGVTDVHAALQQYRQWRRPAAMTGRRLMSFVLAASLSLPLPTRAGSITTAEIVSKTTDAAFSCMQWMPIGICFWLRCSIYDCDVETSLKVGYYNPDLVVSSYNELGGNPWEEIRSVLGSAQKSAAAGLLGASMKVPVDVESVGNCTEGTTANRDHKNLIFREADAIGHPLSSLSGVVSGTGMLCETETTSFVPYFQSSLEGHAQKPSATFLGD